MGHPIPAELKLVYTKLAKERSEIIASLAQDLAIGSEETSDWMDLAANSQELETQIILQSRNEKRLADVSQAMEAIESGQQKGCCLKCGSNILKRLKVVPTARLCVKCSEQAQSKYGRA